MKQTGEDIYFSNGNLLISGEYFVLTGAKALAIPLKYGQQMNVKPIEDNKKIIHWEAYELDNPWFKAIFHSDNLEIIYSNHQEKAVWLQNVLRNIFKNSEIIDENKSYNVLCFIHFSANWGWGSSSSLICNLASWAKIDPFVLNKNISRGSGYDIAASLSQSPVFYQIIDNKPEIIPARFNPDFHDSIYFVHLGTKQNTAESIEMNLKAIVRNKTLVKVISELTEKMAGENNPDEFIRYVDEHEKVISTTLKMTTIKEKFFSDFDGGIKSLGSWGGDFIMAVSHHTDSYIMKYFKNKGLETVFKFDEIIKN
jgi:mevalonate kinase